MEDEAIRGRAQDEDDFEEAEALDEEDADDEEESTF